jgi:hypothetical protein
VTALLLVVAGAGFTAQLITGTPVLGPLGLLFLGVPGFVISQIVRPLPLSWPEVALVTLGTTVILTVLVGIVTALSPGGLDATSAAATELFALALTSTAFLARSTRNRAKRAPIRIQVAPGSIVAAALGLILAGSGFVLATRSAQTQLDASVMQFWTVASTPGGEPVLGLRNATGTSLNCSIAVSRPNQQEFHLDVGAVDDGQSWSGALPPRAVSDGSRWQIALQCSGDDGSDVQRRLFVDPAAS